ncbi:dispatched -like protein [Brachionus plicatilis]|uniref:Dispatched-like protein n=1 Tax=Brachionus plicatilis TaxID=10195 RepID=A0A3M7QJX3_BRAPC|nr:dispatched -like protein [Brachionus plicatilis]
MNFLPFLVVIAAAKCSFYRSRNIPLFRHFCYRKIMLIALTLFSRLKISQLKISRLKINDCSQMILESKNPTVYSLLSFEGIIIQCNFIEQYLKPYLNNGVYKERRLNNGIQVESLSSVITKFSNKDSCNELDRIDVGNFTLIFNYCSSIYTEMSNFSLMDYPSVDKDEKLKKIPICQDQNLIDAYNYLVDKNYFLQNSDYVELSDIIDRDPLDFEQVEPPELKYTSIYLSVNKKDKNFLSKFYEIFLKPHFINKPIEINDNLAKFQIVALNFEIKEKTFEKSFTKSLKFCASSFFVACFLLILLTKSPSLLIAFLIILSLGFLDAYFFYKILLDIEFFSFINLLILVFLTCYTCTNIFLFSDTWSTAKIKNKFILYNFRHDSSKSDMEEDTYESNPFFNNYLENCVFYTYKNVLWPLLISLAVILCGILVLILTCSVVLVKIFAIFLAMAIFFSFFLTIFIVPAVLVLKQKIFCNQKPNLDIKKVQNFLLNFRNFINQLNLIHDKIFELYLPTFIVFYRYILIFVSVMIGACSMVAVFYQPGLKVSDESEFRLFSGNSPIEIYETKFSFKSDSGGIFVYQSQMPKKLAVSFIFGVQVDDDFKLVNKIDHSDISRGMVDFYDEKNQLWFEKFCKSLNNSLLGNMQLDSYEKTAETIEKIVYLEKNEQKNVCFYDLMKVVFSRKCTESNDMVESYCCDLQFPFDSDIFESCLRNKNFLDLFVSPYEQILAEKFYFNTVSGALDIIEYRIVSEHEWTSSYEKMTSIYQQIKDFYQSMVRIKYVDLSDQDQKSSNMEKMSFFVSNFDFFDYQRSIIMSMMMTVSLSFLILVLIILLITRNFFITLISVLTLVMSMSTTLGLLVLFNLKLNIINLISITTSMYLSINSVVYLSVSYSTLLSSSQETYQEFTTMFFVCENTIESLLKRFGSSIFKPCLLILISLTILAPNEIYSFQMIAVFYMLANVFSLFFTFFLYLPLCTITPAMSFCCDFRRDKEFSNFQANNNTSAADKLDHKNENSNVIFTTAI